MKQAEQYMNALQPNFVENGIKRYICFGANVLKSIHMGVFQEEYGTFVKAKLCIASKMVVVPQ